MRPSTNHSKPTLLPTGTKCSGLYSACHFPPQDLATMVPTEERERSERKKKKVHQYGAAMTMFCALEARSCARHIFSATHYSSIYSPIGRHLHHYGDHVHEMESRRININDAHINVRHRYPQTTYHKA